MKELTSVIRRLIPVTAALLTGGLLLPCLRAGEANQTKNAAPKGAGTQTEDLHPFTHLAYIPAGTDLGDIRFEQVRMVKVPTRIIYTMDRCGELAFGDPGGSSACPDARTEAPVPAYEAVYSFTGQPLASDEYAGRHFTFSVLFRPDELTSDAQEALTGRNLSRPEAATYFAVTTYREPVSRVAIDGQESHFCAGNFVDGLWTHTDRGCKDTIGYRAVTAPPDYITVKVDPISPRGKGVGLVSAR
jgi:hypothetical protein